MNVYRITNNELRITELVHIDTYRLQNEKELMDIGVEDYLGDAHTVCIIEWPEKISSLLRGKNCLAVWLDHDGESARRIRIDN